MKGSRLGVATKGRTLVAVMKSSWKLGFYNDQGGNHGGDKREGARDCDIEQEADRGNEGEEAVGCDQRQEAGCKNEWEETCWGYDAFGTEQVRDKSEEAGNR